MSVFYEGGMFMLNPDKEIDKKKAQYEYAPVIQYAPEDWRSIPKKVTELKARSLNLYLKKAEQLKTLFAQIPGHIKTLDLSGNFLSQYNGSELAMAFSGIPSTIKKIILQHNYFSSMFVDYTILLEAIAIGNSLSENSIGLMDIDFKTPEIKKYYQQSIEKVAIKTRPNRLITLRNIRNSIESNPESITEYAKSEADKQHLQELLTYYEQQLNLIPIEDTDNWIMQLQKEGELLVALNNKLAEECRNEIPALVKALCHLNGVIEIDLSDNGLTASHENLLKKYVSENSVKKIKYDADEATSSKEKQPPLPDTSPPLMKREDSPVLDTHDNNNAKSVCLNSNESLFSASEEISLKLKKKVIVVLNKVQYKYANSGPHGVITDLINEITKLNINNEQFKETLITTIDSFNEKLANSRLLNAFDTLKSAIDDNTVDKEHEQILHCIEEKRWWKGKF